MLLKSKEKIIIFLTGEKKCSRLIQANEKDPFPQTLLTVFCIIC